MKRAQSICVADSCGIWNQESAVLVMVMQSEIQLIYVWEPWNLWQDGRTDSTKGTAQVVSADGRLIGRPVG